MISSSAFGQALLHYACNLLSHAVLPVQGIAALKGFEGIFKDTVIHTV